MVYFNWNKNLKQYKGRTYYLPTGIVKNYNVTISEKNLFVKTTDCDIEQYK